MAVHQLPAIRLCQHCKEPNADFYADTAVGSRCKKCECIRRKELYRVKNPEVKRIFKRPVGQSRQESLAAHYQNKKELIKEQAKARRLANPEKYKQKSRLAYEKNTGAWNAKTSRYAAAKKTLPLVGLTKII